QVKRLAGFCSRVDLLFDGDGAGRKAALRSAEMILIAGVKCSVVLLPEGEDVDSILQTKGRDGFESYLENARDGLGFATSTVRDEFSPKEIMAWATGFLGKLTEPTLMAYYLPRIAQGLGVAEAELRSAVGARPMGRTSYGEPAVSAPARPVGAKRQIEKEDLDDKMLLKFPIQYPEYIPDLDARGFKSVLTTAWAKGLWEKIVANQQGDILSGLTQGEKRLWMEFRVERDESQISGKELQLEWEHHCDLIEKFRKKASMKQLMSKLRTAQADGDQARIERINKALSDALRREDEQH
ncbi:MAG: DNA primase, partial [Proteobacteria bacterium]|nr:DNA primase [Pseudomonadota bacterium]MBU1612162.1 DNA primase [Pseudomonadota bacterium]